MTQLDQTATIEPTAVGDFANETMTQVEDSEVTTTIEVAGLREPASWLGQAATWLAEKSAPLVTRFEMARKSKGFRRAIAAGSVAALAPAAAACAPVKEGSPICEITPNLAMDTIAALNEDRLKLGLQKVIWRDDLAELAQEHSDWMAANFDLKHRDPRPAGVSENIFLLRNCGMNGQNANNSLMASPPHRAVMLSADAIWAGVGYTLWNDRIYLTENFGNSDYISPDRSIQQ